MPQFLPFRGLRYTRSAGPLSDLLAPPYDVISPSQQRALEQRNERNAVRLELADGGDERYEAVARLVDQWTAEGALQRDEQPMLYVYEQQFIEEGHVYTRKAIIAGVEAQPWEEGAVKPHEYTMSGPKADRLRLLEATGIQFSPVFMIARDRAGTLQRFIEEVIASADPIEVATSIDGEHHRLWAIEAGTFEMRKIAPLLAESFYIADGHHRYETGVTYRDVRAGHEELSRDHPARFAMTAIVSAQDPGLVIRPIHRMIPRRAPADWRKRLQPAFEIVRVKLTQGEHHRSEEFASLVGSADAVAVGLEPGQVHLLRRKPGTQLGGSVPPGMSEEWASLPPNILRYGVLEPLWGITDEDLKAGAVHYTHAIPEATECMDDHQGHVAFLLNPVGIDAVMSLADKGERMPQKSTFFHPKLGTGLVFHPLNP